MGLNAGARLGPYEIQSALGAGGMGEVYKARDTRLERTVAVKVLPAHVAADPHLQHRFETEARTLAALSHPHICPVYDVGRQDGVDFLVMEYLEGETLAQRLTKSALPLEQALRYAIEIADALAAAHRAGIVHRDLKPGNIMLTRSGGPSRGPHRASLRGGVGDPPIVKLLDFGLAKLTVSPLSALSAAPTQDSPMTVPGTILGTLPYMAPEQLEGGEADARTDIFAFGAVVYEMVTGRKAFEGRSQASLIGAIMHSEPALLAQLQPTAPPSLERLIRTCLVKDPDDRWQSAKDLRRELEWIADERRHHPAIPTSGARQALTWRRSMPLLALLLAIVAIGVIVFLLNGPDPRSSPTVSRFVITPPATAPLANLGGRDVIVSPDGRLIVYVANDATRGRMLFVREIDALEARAVPGTEDAQDPFFSPDGAWIGFERGTALLKVAMKGGPPVEIFDGGVGISGGAWGADDSIIFGTNDGLFRVPAGGGASERLAPDRGGEQYLSPRTLPGGRAVVFWIRKAGDLSTETDRVAVLSLATGEVRILFAGANPFYVLSGHLVFVRGSTLMAVPFDVDRLEAEGDPVPLLDDIRRITAADYGVADNGTLVYVPGSGATGVHTLVSVGRDGGEEPLGIEPRIHFAPRVSPDGQRIAVSTATTASIAPADIWIHDLVRGTTTRLTFDAANDVQPLWSPDGERIVFSSNREGSFDLYWMRADGTGAVERLTTGPPHEFASSWGDGGRTLVFMECRTHLLVACDVSALSIHGERQPKELVRTEFNEVFPTVSPDGRWLAYESNLSGQPEIYVRPFPNVQGGHWQVSAGGGAKPLWALSGEELFYQGGMGLMVVPVETGPIPRIGRPQTLFNLGRYVSSGGRDYDVSPKSDRLVFVMHSTTDVGQIVVVQGWFEELKRLVPTD